MGRLMKDSGIPWIGAIPADWSVNMLSSLFFEHKHKNKNMEETNLLSLSYGKIKRKDINSTEGLLPESFEGYNVIEKGDIVFRLTDLQNDKRSLRTGLCQERGIITSAYLTIRVRETKYHPSYFHYLFHSYDLCKVFYGLGDGVRQGMNYEDLRRLLVFVPSFPEQQKIATFLDQKCKEVDELIALQEKMIEELKAYKQSVITETITKGLNPDAPMKDSGIEWIGQIPEHWGLKRLKYVVSRSSDKAYEGLPYIGLENVESVSGRYVETNSEYDVSQANICKKGDVIFGKLRPYLAKAMSIDKDCCCSSEFLVLHGTNNQDYIRYLLVSNWFIEVVNASTYGTKMPRANADFIMNVVVPITPERGEQLKIVAHLNVISKAIDNLVDIKQSKIAELHDYKKSLIYEYVTGKREVQ